MVRSGHALRPVPALGVGAAARGSRRRPGGRGAGVLGPRDDGRLLLSRSLDARAGPDGRAVVAHGPARVPVTLNQRDRLSRAATSTWPIRSMSTGLKT